MESSPNCKNIFLTKEMSRLMNLWIMTHTLSIRLTILTCRKKTSRSVPQHNRTLQDGKPSKPDGTAERLNLIITDVYNANKNSILNQDDNSAIGSCDQNDTIGITENALSYAMHTRTQILFFVYFASLPYSTAF